MDTKRPALKQAIPWFPLPGNMVQIGEEPNHTFTVQDSDGKVKDFLAILGGRSVQELTDELSARWHQDAGPWVSDALKQLLRRGLLTVGGAGGEILPSWARDRYKANLAYWELVGGQRTAGDIQTKIGDSRILVLGVGGLGTHISLDLACLGFGSLRLADYDTVDLSNLNRQILYVPEDVGKSKVDIAGARLRRFHPGIDVDACSVRIEGPEDAIPLMEGVDWVVCVADKPTVWIHRWVNRSACLTGRPVTYAGILNRVGAYYTVIPGSTGCVECQTLQVSEDERRLDALMEQTEHQRTNAAIGPHVSILAGIVACEVVKGVTGIARLQSAGNICHFDFTTLRMLKQWPWFRDPECPVCANGEPACASAPS